MSSIDTTDTRHRIDDDEWQYGCFQVHPMRLIQEVRCPEQEEPPYPVCYEAREQDGIGLPMLEQLAPSDFRF